MKRLILIMMALGAIVACQSPKHTAMQYRPLGNTGLMVSEVGLGCEAFADTNVAFCKEFMKMALDSGVNFIDIFSPDPVVRTNIGLSLSLSKR